VRIVVEMVGISHSMSRVLFVGEPARNVAIPGGAGLSCLILGAASAVRNWFRRAPDA